MDGIYCATCKFQDRDDWDMPCRVCKVLKKDVPPTGYVKLEYVEPVVEPVTPSAVDHPSHYQSENGMECIDEMVLVFGAEAVKNFCLCNVWKYRYRAADKNGQEDMDKAHWYMAKYKELTDNGQWEQTRLYI